MKIKLSNYIAQWLVGEGIEQVFMVTGGGAMHQQLLLSFCNFFIMR